MSRFKGRPAGGLPERLPADEEMLWQGAPEWRGLWRHAFRARLVALYFGGLIAWRVGAGLWNGHGVSFALGSGVSGLALGVGVLAMFAALSWLMARTTTYSITDRRVVMTYGMALPKSINLPYSRIEAADLRVNLDGSGDIALRLPSQVSLSYLLLWPHVRAGKQSKAQPVLRCIAEPQAVAGVLAQAIGRTMAPRERAMVVEPAIAEPELMRVLAA